MIGLQLVVYSLLLAGLCSLTHGLTSFPSRSTLAAGLVGAVLCLIGGVGAIRGRTGKLLAVATLAPLGFVLLAQTVIAWTSGSSKTPVPEPAAWAMTVLCGLTIVMLMRIAYAGAVLGAPSTSPGAGVDGLAAPTGRPKTPVKTSR